MDLTPAFVKQNITRFPWSSSLPNMKYHKSNIGVVSAAKRYKFTYHGYYQLLLYYYRYVIGPQLDYLILTC